MNNKNNEASLTNVTISMIGRRGHKCHLSVMFHLCDDLRASTLISSIIHLPMSLMMVVMMIKTIPKQQ